MSAEQAYLEQPTTLCLPQNAPDADARKLDIAKLRGQVIVTPGKDGQMSEVNAGKMADTCKGEQPWAEILRQFAFLTNVGTTMTKENIDQALGKASVRTKNFWNTLLHRSDEKVPTTPAAEAAEHGSARVALVERYKLMFDEKDKWWQGIRNGGDVLDDAVFGFQAMNGAFPEFFTHVAGALPASSGITDADVKDVLPEGETLASLAKADRLWACDLTWMLDGIANKDAGALEWGLRAAPIAVFYVDLSVGGEGRIMPLCIRLFPEGGNDGKPNPVFTPKDANPEAWTAAKLFYNNAAVCCHTCETHMQGTFMDEHSIAGVKRNLSTAHPMANFMSPFTIPCWTFKVINDSGMMAMAPNLIKPYMPPVFERVWPRHSFRRFNAKATIKDRGLDKIKFDYPYRDTWLAMWVLFEAFTRRVVEDVYASDDDVKQDHEMQAMGHDISAKDALGLPHTAVASTGGEFETREQVIEHFTTVIHFQSCGHGYDACNWWFYIWIPAAPLHMHMEPPTDKAAVTAEQILEGLPWAFHPDAKAQLTGLVAVLEHYDQCKVTTGGPAADFVPHREGYLQGFPGLTAHVKTFFAELDDLEEKLKDRDAARERDGLIPYDGLYPTHLPGSIWY